MPSRLQECPSYEQLIDYQNRHPNTSSLDWIGHHLDTCLECQRLINTAPPADSATASFVPSRTSPSHLPTQGLNKEERVSSVRADASGLANDTTQTVGVDSFGPNDVPGALPAFLHSPDGEYLGRYRVLGKFKPGGMGIVYKVFDPQMNKVLALKMIKESATTPKHLELFKKEIASLGGLKHENIIPILHCDQIEGKPYFTMEVASQGSLLNHLARFRQDTRGTVQLMARVARAIQTVHDKGVIHRDLKPGNILLDDNDKPLVSDFGLAIPDESHHQGSHHKGVGTLPYMAPEQFQESPELRPQADIWAMGVILYEILTGAKPFPGKDREEIQKLICTVEPKKPRDLAPKLPRHLEIIILKCLEKNPDRRYPSAAALAEDLEGWLKGEPPGGHTHPFSVIVSRWFQRHPVTVTTLFALFLICLAILVIRELNDPYRPVRQMQAELKQSKTVNLLKGNKPKYIGWPIGEEQLQRNSQNLDFLSYRAGLTCVLELLPETPISAYRFHGKVRHDSGKTGEVGLAFCLGKYRDSRGPFVAFAAISFNDLEKQNEIANPIPVSVQTFLNYDDIHNKDRMEQHHGMINRLTFQPSLPDENTNAPWRPVRVLVTPQKITITFENKTQEFNPTVDFLPLIQDDFQVGKIESGSTNIQLGSGVGLYTFHALASFKDLLIEPVDPSDPQYYAQLGCGNPLTENR